MKTHLYPPRIMGEPTIGADLQYHIWVMWLDGISVDDHVVDPADKRYIENKRSTAVHSRGWESIWAAAVDDRVNMVHDGNYMKIPLAEKNNIMTRIQSWILVAAEQGQVASSVVLPRPVPKRKLRPGQSKAKEKPNKPTKTPNTKQNPKKKRAKSKPNSKPATKPKGNKRKVAQSSSEGTACPAPQLEAHNYIYRLTVLGVRIVF